MKIPLKHVADIPQMAWVRLAAFIDGEGHLTIARQTSSFKKLRSPHHWQHITHVSVSNTDPRLPLWLLETFGGAVTMQQKHKRNPNWKDISHWRLTGKDAGIVLRECLPFLLLKKDQAEVLLAFQSLLESGTRRGKRRAISVEEWDQREGLRSKILVMTARGKRMESDLEKGA